LIRSVHEIAVALNNDIFWPATITRNDAVTIHLLREITRSGKVSLSVESITLEIPVAEWTTAETSLRQSGRLITTPAEPPAFATLFGELLDLGPYTVVITSREFVVSPQPSQAETLVLDIVLAEPLLSEFKKFAKG
jgi:hypothetical protein